jgi:hypothetical protein
MTGSVCTFPLEYCEFGSSFTKCKEWLNGTNSDLYDKYYSEGEQPHIMTQISLSPLCTCAISDALQAKLGTMTMEAQTKLEKDAVEKEAKAEAKADAALKKKLSSQVRTLGVLSK